MRELRSAAAAAHNGQGNLVVAGGWDGALALSTCELFVPSPTRAPDGPVEGGAWTAMSSLRRPRCFCGASFDIEGTLFVIGGGDSLWQGSEVFTSTEMFRGAAGMVRLATSAAAPYAAIDMDEDESAIEAHGWEDGPALNQQRCGLGAATTPDGRVWAVGGYGGGLLYHRTIEALEPVGWRLHAPMREPRTGAGVAVGPGGVLYVVGGSPDGSDRCDQPQTPK
jgi:hypothetical protein